MGFHEVFGGFDPPKNLGGSVFSKAEPQWSMYVPNTAVLPVSGKPRCRLTDFCGSVVVPFLSQLQRSCHVESPTDTSH